MLPGRLVRDTRVRAVTLWIGLRTLFFFGFSIFAAFDGVGVDLLSLFVGAATALWVVGLTATLVLVDVSVVRETNLFANLGVSRRGILRLALPPVLVLETALQLVLAVIPS